MQKYLMSVVGCRQEELESRINPAVNVPGHCLMVFLLNFMKCEVKSEDKIYIYTAGLLSTANTDRPECKYK